MQFDRRYRSRSARHERPPYSVNRPSAGAVTCGFPSDDPQSLKSAAAGRSYRMSYYFSKTLLVGFDEALRRTIDALKHEGFGIITEVDVKRTFQEKLGVDFRNYRILGACNPTLAYEALQLEDKVGTMLPCNVVVQEIGQDRTEIAAIDPSHRCKQSIIRASRNRRSAFRSCCGRSSTEYRSYARSPSRQAPRSRCVSCSLAAGPLRQIRSVIEAKYQTLSLECRPHYLLE